MRAANDPVWGNDTAEPENTGPALYRIDQPWSEENIPRRPWVAPGYILRKSVGALAGPGSAGKSSIVVAQTTALALGRTFGRFHAATGQPMRCLSYNVEDDADEQRRRYSAMCRQFDVLPRDILPNLTLCGPNDVGTLVAMDRFGSVLVNTRAMDELEELIGDTRPDAAWLDPFVELHGAEENDNTAVRLVMARFRQLAKTHNMGLTVLFHTRKGVAVAGDPDSIRGASSIVGAARIALTVNVMTQEEAEKLGRNPDHRRDYFRIDDAKKNYSRIEDAEWFERQEYELDNGDRVAVPMPWAPPAPRVDQSKLAELASLVAQGSPVGPWSPRLSAEQRSFRHALDRAGITNATQQKATLGQLLASRLVHQAEFKRARGASGDPSQGLRTDGGEPFNVNWTDQRGATE